MKSSHKLLIDIAAIAVAAGITFYFLKDANINPHRRVGQALDSLNGVKVYYNGETYEVYGENKSADGYYLGLKYQCVEFVNRYYYQHYGFKIKNPYGNAWQFYNRKLPDGALNSERGLMQFTNPSQTRPREGDIVVFDRSAFAHYGHVGIVSAVSNSEVEIIQQNGGPFGGSRLKIPLVNNDQLYFEKKRKILGWLRMP
jgi:surface antigen